MASTLLNVAAGLRGAENASRGVLSVLDRRLAGQRLDLQAQQEENQQGRALEALQLQGQRDLGVLELQGVQEQARQRDVDRRFDRAGALEDIRQDELKAALGVAETQRGVTNKLNQQIANTGTLQAKTTASRTTSMNKLTDAQAAKVTQQVELGKLDAEKGRILLELYKKNLPIDQLPSFFESQGLSPEAIRLGMGIADASRNATQTGGDDIETFNVGETRILAEQIAGANAALKAGDLHKVTVDLYKVAWLNPNMTQAASHDFVQEALALMRGDPEAGQRVTDRSRLQRNRADMASEIRLLTTDPLHPKFRTHNAQIQQELIDASAPGVPLHVRNDLLDKRIRASVDRSLKTDQEGTGDPGRTPPPVEQPPSLGAAVAPGPEAPSDIVPPTAPEQPRFRPFELSPLSGDALTVPQVQELQKAVARNVHPMIIVKRLAAAGYAPTVVTNAIRGDYLQEFLQGVLQDAQQREDQEPSAPTPPALRFKQWPGPQAQKQQGPLTEAAITALLDDLVRGVAPSTIGRRLVQAGFDRRVVLATIDSGRLEEFLWTLMMGKLESGTRVAPRDVHPPEPQVPAPALQGATAPTR